MQVFVACWAYVGQIMDNDYVQHNYWILTKCRSRFRVQNVCVCVCF